jgi:hypothetical protein
MKPLRVLLTILVAGGLAFLLFRGIRGAPPKQAAVAPEIADDGGPETLPFDPFGNPPAATTAGAQAAAPPPAPDVDETLKGTSTTSTSDVSLVVPYKTGTKCRYRVREAELQKDRDSDEALWLQFVWTVSTDVVQGDGTGAARVRFQIESFHYQTEAPGRRIDIDSENPDRKLIDDPSYGLARTLKPWLAIRRMPVEFVIDAGGVIRAVDGAKEMNRKFLDVVATFGAQQEQDADDAPTAASLIERWGAYLFPALGGGKIAGGATRATAFRRTQVDGWACLASGAFRATHDDPDAFRVEFKGKPEIEELGGAAKHPKYMNVEKAKIISSIDDYVASWRYDRAKGRLLASRKRAKYCLVVAYRAGTDENHQPKYDHPYIDFDLAVDVELLDQ